MVERGPAASVQPLRVLHIIPGLRPGGAETVLYRLATRSPHIHHELVCLTEREWYTPRFEAAGIAVHHLDMGPGTAFSTAVARLRRLIRTSDADVIQCWMYRANVLGGILGRLSGLPVIWNIRCSSLEPLSVRSRLLARFGGRIAGMVPNVVVNCSERSARIHAPLGYSAAEEAIIHNGYDIDEFKPDGASRAATRQELGFDDTAFVIGLIGRWHPQKAVPTLLRAVRLLADRGVSVRLVLVGRDLDPSNADLERCIAQAGVSGVQRMGPRSDIPALARALDLHVLPSVGAEGFPNAVAETMMSGTPNVVTDVGESAMIVGTTGWVVAPGEAEPLADAIGKAHEIWSNDPAAWNERRAAARDRIVENFTLDAMVTAYEGLWRRFARRRAA